MIYVGIDTVKDQHNCAMLGPDAEELSPVFTIRNNSESYDALFETIESVSKDVNKIKSDSKSPATLFLQHPESASYLWLSHLYNQPVPYQSLQKRSEP